MLPTKNRSLIHVQDTVKVIGCQEVAKTIENDMFSRESLDLRGSFLISLHL